MKKHQGTSGSRPGTDRQGDRPADMGNDVKEKVASAAADVRDGAEALLEEGREKVEELGQTAAEAARNRADEQLERVVDGIRIFADVLRQGGQNLSGERSQYRSMLTAVADRAEGVSRYLDHRDVQSMTREVRRFARENTPLFLGGAFALGLLGARFLKSSSDAVPSDDEYGRGPGMAQRYDRMLPATGTRGGTGQPGVAGGYRQPGTAGGYGAGTSGSPGGAGTAGGFGAPNRTGGTTGTNPAPGSGSRGGSDRSDTRGGL